MGKALKSRIKRHRRSEKAFLRCNKSNLYHGHGVRKIVKRKHIRVGGRTGQIHSKQSPSKKHLEYYTSKPNPPFMGVINGK